MTGLVLALVIRIGGLFGLKLSAFAAGAALAAVLSIAAGGAAVIIHHRIYQAGYDAALAAIAAEDEAAITRATAQRSQFRDCRARGGAWDQSTGECR